MRLDELVKGVRLLDRRGRWDVEINNISTDSRSVQTGTLFAALPGVERDGHDFIRSAVEQGASAVLCERWPEDLQEDRRAQIIIVSSVKHTLSILLNRFYDFPTRDMLIAGVTGTNGKTTVSYLLESMLKAGGHSVGLIGTIAWRYPGAHIPATHTTPDPVVLFKHLAKMRDVGVRYVVMEVSSHALEQQRVHGIDFRVAAFTNLTQDHLDYHGTLENYARAKARFFSEVLKQSAARGRMAVVNADDSYAQQMLTAWGSKKLCVSLNKESKENADIYPEQVRWDEAGLSAKIHTPKGEIELKSSLVGEYNLTNILIATGMAMGLGLSRDRISEGIEMLDSVPGRLERVHPTKKNASEFPVVYVDYAHTPDGLKNVLVTLRKITQGRLCVVFGCGGDRDRTKRALMGKVAAQHADMIVVTSDNPRTEEPTSIVRAIEEGIKGVGFSEAATLFAEKTYKLEVDRAEAVRYALRHLKVGDVLLIAGKGHETEQIVGTQKFRLDDRELARRMMDQDGIDKNQPSQGMPS